ncbi:hypothetical protein KKH59_00265 [Patescibacteria group bacterium]|nr:hypothetical protein [Patescibacteria group bacterium]
MAKKTISDLPSKKKCKKWLESKGFTDVKPAKNQKCDLIARKNDKTYFIEVKYSSKEKGEFFGTVMLTEMYQAIKNKNNYLFLICRGVSGNINGWFFNLFTVENFIKYCTLTTPIFHYRISQDENKELSVPKFGKRVILASECLIENMWKDFQKWKIGFKTGEKNEK